MKGTTANSYLAYKNGKWTDVKGQKLTYADDHQQKTTKGSRANNGTVCNYPYTIGESLSLTGARAQDYQLRYRMLMYGIVLVIIRAEVQQQVS